MKATTYILAPAMAALTFASETPRAWAQMEMSGVTIQCPGDVNGDAIPDPTIGNGSRRNPAYDLNVKCFHLGAGDGYAAMADGRMLYMFGFSNLTGVPAADVMAAGMLAGNSPAPTLTVDEGNEVYLTLTNVGMTLRPDLFDPHTVHWHGFPNAAPVFDGEPEASFGVNMGASVTYYYKVVEPGTYMYHCHMEATEHMQMGMLGNLFVRPRQDKLAAGTVLAGGFIHQAGFRYAYNDGDGSTRYDIDVPLQLGSFDSDFHDASESVQPLPFAAMKDKYAFLNGRGYPDSVNPNPLPAWDPVMGPVQRVSSYIEAARGQKVLLRISNLNITRFYTLAVTGIPMKVVGHNARLLRGPSPDGGLTPGKSLAYDTRTVTLGGGEALDAILDTTNVPAGTYFIYTTNLNYLSNGDEDFGGMMTEVVVR